MRGTWAFPAVAVSSPSVLYEGIHSDSLGRSTVLPQDSFSPSPSPSRHIHLSQKTTRDTHTRSHPSITSWTRTLMGHLVDLGYPPPPIRVHDHIGSSSRIYRCGWARSSHLSPRPPIVPRIQQEPSTARVSRCVEFTSPHLRARRANRRPYQDLRQPNSSSALPPIRLPSHPSLPEDHTRHPYQVPPLNPLLDTDPDGSSRRLRVSTSLHSSSRPHRKLIKTLPLWLGRSIDFSPHGAAPVRAPNASPSLRETGPRSAILSTLRQT
jgi:hypothetical protein